jgi:hypothetical protein
MRYLANKTSAAAELLRFALSDRGQESISSILIAVVDSDGRRWERAFVESPGKLGKLADDPLRKLRFCMTFALLPDPVKGLAKTAYKQFRRNRNHPSLEFKPLKKTMQPIYSLRIGLGYCAIGVMKEDGEVGWCWIGSHADYDNVIV